MARKNIDCPCVAVEGFKRKDHENAPLGLNGTFTFVYDYPLSNTANFTHRLTPKMTRIDLLQFGADDYKRIYREEDQDMGKKTGHIPGMLNRQTSEGRHGIWGHDIGDLVFEGIEVDTTLKIVSFGIGS